MPSPTPSTSESDQSKSPTTSTLLSQAQALIPQTTGEWFTNLTLSNIGGLPSFRKSLLGGKSLNRFSSFVTSGTEEWILWGSGKKKDQRAKPSREKGLGHTREVSAIEERFRTISGLPVSSDFWDVYDKLGISHSKESSGTSLEDEDGGAGSAASHFIDAGPAWKAKIPYFQVYVHSPTKRTDGIKGQYVMYSVTSVFGEDDDISEDKEKYEGGYEDEEGEGESSWDIRGHTPTPSTYDPSYSSTSSSTPPTTSSRTKSITVFRRFSHFVLLHTLLSQQLPAIALPPLPSKSYAGRFSTDFVEARRKELQRYLKGLVRHPVVRGVEVMMWWLSCESEYVRTISTSPTESYS